MKSDKEIGLKGRMSTSMVAVPGSGSRCKGMSLLLAFALAALPLSGAAFANDVVPDSPEAVLTSAVPYLPDSGFNHGLYLADAFADSPSKSYGGRKIAFLGDGSVIVAGNVPPRSGGTNPVNLGLVHYRIDGQRQSWPDPGAYGFNGGQYIVYPNIDSATGVDNVREVRDIKVYGNRLFVMVDHNDNASGDIDSYILVFTTDGRFLSRSVAAGTIEPEYGGGLVVYEPADSPGKTTVLSVASTFSNGVWRPTFRTGVVDSGGSITFNDAIHPNPGNYCPTNRGCILRSIEKSLFGGTRFYLAGTRQDTGDNWDFLVMAVDAAGAPINMFNGNGVTVVKFDDGGANYDDANSVAVVPSAMGLDQIFLSGLVNRACRDGVGIAKLTQVGVLDTGFGDPVAVGRSGKTIVGGVDLPAGDSCSQHPFISKTAVYSNSSALSSNHDILALAGFSVTPPPVLCIPGDPCREDDVDGTLIVLDAKTGELKSFLGYPYQDAVGGPRTRHSGFWGVTVSSNLTFTAAGDVRYFQSAAGQPSGALQYATLRFKSDRIFANTFGYGEDLPSAAPIRD